MSRIVCRHINLEKRPGRFENYSNTENVNMQQKVKQTTQKKRNLNRQMGHKLAEQIISHDQKSWMTLARKPKQCSFCYLEGGILEETSGRRHLGGIWEAFGSSLGALWGALWELGRPWGLQGHLEQKMLQIHFVLLQKYKKKIISLKFFGGRCHDCKCFTAT